MIRLRSVLKNWFSRGKRPTEEQFADLIDSFYHKTEDAISADTIEGLVEALVNKADIGHTHEVSDVNGLSEALADIMPSEHTHAMSEVEGLSEALGDKADKATTLSGYNIDDAYTKTETDALLNDKADKATTLAGYNIDDAYTKSETDALLDDKADKATTLAGYNIEDAYTKTETDAKLATKADKATTLSGYNIGDAYTKTETDAKLETKADKATTLAGYNIDDAYTKTETDAKVEKSKDYDNATHKPQINGTTLQGNKTADDLDLVQKSLFLNTLFPKGHIIMTYNKVSPATYIGGTWELIDEGYYPVATVKDIIDEQTERFKQAGLPNIMGKIDNLYLKGDRRSVSKTGALSGSTTENNEWAKTQGGNATNLTKIDFNASNSDSIYGASDTVQPKSVLFYVWVRTDDDILTYNFTNISFKASDFHVSATGQVSSALYPEPGEIIQTIRSAFNPNAKYVGTVWRKFIDGIYFSSGNTFEYRGEQLPNIKGEIGDINFRGSSAQSITKSGALVGSAKANGNNIGCGSPAGDVIKSLNFNAGNSNSIYVDGGKVRPNTITTYAWIRVDGLSQDELSALESYLV